MAYRKRRSPKLPIEPDSSARVYYTFGDELGRGRYAKVMEAINKKTGRKVAVKIIDKKKIKKIGRREDVFLRRETDICRDLSHPNIVTFYEFYENSDEISIVMELMQGGNLIDYVQNHGPFSEREARIHLRGVLDAIEYLHKQSIAHRDLKPENLVFDTRGSDAVLKLIDFGFAKNEIDHGPLKTPLGTAGYCSLEIITAEVTRKPYTLSVDMFAIGCVVYFMLYGFAPFTSDIENVKEREKELDKKVEENEYTIPEKPSITDEARDFIIRLLSVDPSARLTAPQSLCHKWMDDPSIHRETTSISSPTLSIPVPTSRRSRSRSPVSSRSPVGSYTSDSSPRHSPRRSGDSYT